MHIFHRLAFSDFMRAISIDYSLWRFRWKHVPITGRPFPSIFRSYLGQTSRLIRIRSPTLVDHIRVY
jgi:hypothetical protein